MFDHVQFPTTEKEMVLRVKLRAHTNTSNTINKITHLRGRLSCILLFLKELKRDIYRLSM